MKASLLMSAPDWDAWRFLLGEWVGEGSGQPGQGAGGFSFALDVQQSVLVRRNHTDFPASKDQPASAHDDLMIVYQQPGAPARAIYFDNEGHVITYTTNISPDGSTVVFLSDPAPAAPRFRLSYTREQGDAVAISFEVAPPGTPQQFHPYLNGRAHRC